MNKKVITLSILFLIIINSSSQQTQQKLKQSNQKQISQPKINTVDPINPSQSQKLSQIIYTQNIQQFKSKKYNQRLEVVVGCWLMSKQYLDQSKSDYLFFKDEKLKQLATLYLVKQCMKKISRKEAVVKITELVGKNMQKAKKYEDIVQKQVIDKVFIEINKSSVGNLEQFQQIGNEQIVTGQNGINETEKLQAVNQNTHQIKSNTQTNETDESQKPQAQTQTQQQQNLNSLAMSQFDSYLLDLLKKYNSEFDALRAGKDGIKGRVEQQLKKRQKYYLGFIPASSFTHSVFLVTISLSMVFCCTCYKYYKMRSNEKNLLKNKMCEQGQDCDHKHSPVKQYRKMAKMTQLTMKRKVK